MPVPASPSDASFCRVLLADDDEEWRELLAFGLRQKGYFVTTAADGRQAVELAREEAYHIAVFDVEMPNLTGPQAMAAIKELDPNIEFVLMTARDARMAGPASAIQYGYLIKPFSMVELEALIPGLYEKVNLKTLVGLYETGRAVFSEVKLAELLPRLVQLAKKVLIADDTSVLLMGQDNLLRVAATTLAGGVSLGRAVALGEGVAGRVAQWRAGVMINGPLTDDPRFADLPSRKEVQFSLVHPILLQQEIVGILTASRRSDKTHFSPQDLRHAAVFCSHVAQAIHNAKLYASIEEARDAAVSASQLKDDLLNTTTHDLKTPLQVILGYNETLLMNLPPGERTYACAEKIGRSAKRMLVAIQQMLRRAQVESSGFKLDPEPAAVVPLLSELVADLAVVAAPKSIRVELKTSLAADASAVLDPTALAEIVSNLVSNAVKFCPKGASIVVGVERRDGLLAVSVADDGPGIAPETQASLFQRFQRGDLRAPEGSGYGLSIVKRLTEASGGRVELDSELGKGSTFRILLPG